jgi:hypothetical protein
MIASWYTAVHPATYGATVPRLATTTTSAATTTSARDTGRSPRTERRANHDSRATADTITTHPATIDIRLSRPSSPSVISKSGMRSNDGVGPKYV